MTGGSIPYHLRANKSVDRQTFVDLLLYISKVFDMSKYSYLGFGGHSFEDFKQVHMQFGISEMKSLETDDNVYKRQSFNLPFSCIKCNLKSSQDYIEELEDLKDTDDNLIAWLDYAAPAHLRNYLEESQVLLSKMKSGDIFRITLNANPQGLGGRPGPDLQRQRQEKFSEIVGDEASAGLTELDFTAANYPNSLKIALKYYIQQIFNENTDFIFQPLTIFSYSDGQKMLTVTGVVLDATTDIQNFLDLSGISNWPLANTEWGKPKNIDIPDFTLREKMFVDSLLPKHNAEELAQKLGFHFGISEEDSLIMLENYVIFYRYASHFTKIVI